MAVPASELKIFKEKLERLKRDLEAQAGELEKAPSFGSDVDSFEEEAEEAEATGVNLGIQQLVKSRLERVREALQKIKDGKYGACERCGGAIAKELLLIDPESELCRNCKAK